MLQHKAAFKKEAAGKKKNNTEYLKGPVRFLLPVCRLC
jgi:hypothetical protein